MADCEIGRVSPFIETLHATCDNEILFIVCPGIYQMAEISPVRSEKTVIYCESEKKLEMKFNLSERVRSKGPVPFHSIWGWGESSHPHLLMWWVFKSLSLCVSVCVFARSRFFARSFLASESPEESWRGEDEENEQCDVLDEIYSMTDWLPYIVLGIEITFVPHSTSRRNVVQYCLQGARRPSATIASLSLAYS